MDYGDGKTYVAKDSETAAEKSFWHKYEEPNYKVTATITDGFGQSASIS